MAKVLTSLDDWREYFSTANSDIFDIITHAITVAAADYPREFTLNRGGIAELLFSRRGRGGIELAVLPSDDPAKMTPATGEEEVGLPRPPMDERDLLATPAWMELSTARALVSPGEMTRMIKGSMTINNTSEEEEVYVGLPCPPMDETDLLGIPDSMDLSKIFDGLDDDGSEFHSLLLTPYLLLLCNHLITCIVGNWYIHYYYYKDERLTM